ncbi:hypothetical protein QL285_052360 [Trifolium repens]|nr:hypothetical protein QL285_052360 [Trifolium repens]
MIGNLGPEEFQLLVHFVPIYHFTLPNSNRTSVHNQDNWLYDLEGEDETDPETPSLYHYTPGPPPPTPPAASTTAPPPQEDYGDAIASLPADLATLRSDLTGLKDLVVIQLDRCFDMIHRFIRDLAPPPPSG